MKLDVDLAVKGLSSYFVLKILRWSDVWLREGGKA